MLKKTFLSILCTVSIVGAAEIFVSKSGNDKNPGTAEAPLATIGRAARIVNPGDVIKILPGIYREQVVFNRPGTAEAPIVVEGTRGENGEYLTIVESNGTVLKDWTPATEIGPNVWKTPLAKRPNQMMLDGDRIVLVNEKAMDKEPMKELPKELDQDSFWGKFDPGSKRLSGFDFMRLPADIWVSHQYFRGRKEQFWPTIGNVLTGWKNGYLYLRFANGDKPEEHSIIASYGLGFIIEKSSYMTIRDLHMRGSRWQLLIKSGTNYIVERCLLMHGSVRVQIERNVKDSIIRDNVMTSGFITSEFCGHRGMSDMRGGLLYVVFKYLIGVSSSDDDGVVDYGVNTKILNNVVTQGLLGISSYGTNVEVAGNVVHKQSSIGICTVETTVGQFHHNLVMDCGIPLRLHHFRHKRAKREEYHYCNLFIQPPHDGDQVFVHSVSYLTPDDAINFENGTDVYKKNPPNPVDGGKIYLYHNTFWGGKSGGYPTFHVNGLYQRFRSPLPFFVINNIVKDSYRLSTKSHELTGPNLLYVFDKDVPMESRRDKDVARLNKVVNLEDTKRIWNNNGIPGLPDLTLAPNSPALEAGVDVSKPFTVDGKEYPALPGMKPGYFKGKAPAAGAFQEGESQEHFIAMYKHAGEIFRMLKELKAKTVAEARRNATGK